MVRKKLHNIVDGEVQCDTFTVGGLISKLKEFPEDLPVVGERDSFGAPIAEIYTNSDNDDMQLFKEKVVVLDVSSFFFNSKALVCC